MTLRPTDHALWTAVIETLTDTVLPALTEPHARLQAERLVGLAHYARDRGPDPTPERLEQVRALIGGDDPVDVLTDPDDPRRGELRGLLTRHLDDDLATEQILLHHFHDSFDDD